MVPSSSGEDTSLSRWGHGFESRRYRHIAELCNGSTEDFDSSSGGSNPPSAAMQPKNV